MQTPTQSTPNGDWPADAVPREWVDSLFAKMATRYGGRVADMWRGLDGEEVRKAWGVEMAKLSPEQLREGVRTLADAFQQPPNVGQFLAHCRAARQAQTARAVAALTDQRRADVTTQREGMDRLRRELAPLNAPRGVGVDWAIRLLERGTSASGAPLPSEVVRVARTAIANKTGKRGGKDAD